MTSDRDWLLHVLSDGKPHTHAEIMRRSIDERGCGLTPHSRAADLRRPEHGGHNIEVTTWRANGRVHSSYRLIVSCVESQALPSSPDGDPAATAAVAVCGSTDATGASSQPSLFEVPAGARHRGAYDEQAA